MNIFSWIAQVLLAATFIWSSATKLLSSPATLAAMWPWTGTHLTLVKFTAIVDLLAGIGLILPTLLRIRPILTVYAAIGTIVLMIVAGIFHIMRGEGNAIGVNIFFAIVAGFVVWARRTRNSE